MVKIKNIHDYLAENPFFEGMAENYLELIAGCGTLVHFKKGEFLIREGDEANDFFLIRKGEVAVESFTAGHGPMVVSKVREGQVTGFSWLFPPYRSHFDSLALTEVEAVRLDGKCLRGKAGDDHELGYQLMQRFAQLMLERMQATRRQALDVYGQGKDAKTGTE